LPAPRRRKKKDAGASRDGRLRKKGKPQVQIIWELPLVHFTTYARNGRRRAAERQSAEALKQKRALVLALLCGEGISTSAEYCIRCAAREW